MQRLRSSAPYWILLVAAGCGTQVALVPTEPRPYAEAVVLPTIVETIPGTDASFTLIEIPGGTFTMGSPVDESERDEDEGPQREITVAPFFVGAHEVRYDAWAIFRSRERDNAVAAPGVTTFDPDIIARPSPPYEDPAHGMGTLGHPAVGMTQWGAPAIRTMAFGKDWPFLSATDGGRVGICLPCRYDRALQLQ